MTNNPTIQTNSEANTEHHLDRLHDQLLRFDALLHEGSKEEALKAFDAETEALLSEVFGNPSELSEAYVYAELGEAGAWINLQEEAQLDGEQDVEHLSLQQRRGVLEQAIAEVKARLKR